MGKDSNIQWTHHTFNPWTGCTKVSEACKFCYAEGLLNRWKSQEWGPQADRKRTSPANWAKVLQWDKAAEKAGERHRVFCASLADVFDEHASIKPEWRTDLFELIKKTPNLDWLLLTKRPENYANFLPEDWGSGYKNVWLGISVENQQRANDRIPILYDTPAAVKFLSVEPMLGPIDLENTALAHFVWGKGHSYAGHGIDWVIIGGESGYKSKIRPLNLNHVQSLVNQCQYNGAKVFFKQLGTIVASELNLQDKKGGTLDEFPPHLEYLKVREFPNGK